MVDLAEPTATYDARRVPPLPGCRNFRDLGGYPTVDGRQIRWGLLFRSGSLAEITAEGREKLKVWGIRGLCDLRSSRERIAEPYNWHGELGISYWCRDYETSFGELRKLLEAPLATGEETREAMLAGYRRLPYEQAPAYTELFRRLAAEEVPLIFNCSAGKDRTGAGAALILIALGVPREIVVEDYVLTDKIVDLAKALTGTGSGGSSLLARKPPEVVRAILGCDPAYIAAALETIEATSGSLNNYLQDTLGIGPATLDDIRSRFLENGRPAMRSTSLNADFTAEGDRAPLRGVEAPTQQIT